MVLTTVGAKSGLQRSTPVGSFPSNDGSWVIVASAAGGRKNPAWYHNLAAHPDQVQIEAAGRKVAVVAEQLHGADRDRAWQQITVAARRYVKDASKTDRRLPIIRLVAVA
jgi:deazaflavin-dependent oxidoreductase (nitroreductase family)